MVNQTEEHAPSLSISVGLGQAGFVSGTGLISNGHSHWTSSALGLVSPPGLLSPNFSFSLLSASSDITLGIAWWFFQPWARWFTIVLASTGAEVSRPGFEHSNIRHGQWQCERQGYMYFRPLCLLY
jgi:hypothetical protein